MLKKFFIVALILTSNFVIAETSEAAQYDSENYCCRDSYCGDYYGEQNYNGEYCGGYGCR